MLTMTLADALTFIDAAGVVRVSGEDRRLTYYGTVDGELHRMHYDEEPEPASEDELEAAVTEANWSMIVRSRTPMSDLEA